jgi:hypothetical protein
MGDDEPLDDKKFDRTFFEDMWDGLADWVEPWGIPRSAVKESRDILEKGFVSWGANKAAGAVGLPGKDFSWDESFGGYIDPVAISYPIKAFAHLWDKGKPMQDKLVDMWYEMLPVFMKRSWEAKKQIDAGRYLDKNGNAIAGKFGYGDFAGYVMFGRNYDMSLEQRRKMTDNNPLQTPYAMKQYVKKAIGMDGLKYSGRNQARIERMIMENEGGLWREGDNLRKELADAADAMDPTKKAALSKLDVFLQDKGTEEILNYFANSDYASIAQYLRSPGSKIIPSPENAPSLKNESLDRLKSRLRNYVNDYYNTQAASVVLQKMFIQTMDDAPTVKFTWDKLPAPGGGRIANKSLEEQGYLFALTRLYKDMQDEGIDYGPRIPRLRR